MIITSHAQTTRMLARNPCIPICLGKKSIMNRSELEAYITEIYSTEGEHPFDQYPSFLMFRHSGNREVICRHYGHPQKESETSCRGVNLKCDTRLIGSFRDCRSSFSRWYMNRPICSVWRRRGYDANESPGMIYVIFSCRFSIRFQLTNPYRSLTRNMTKQMITDR